MSSIPCLYGLELVTAPEVKGGQAGALVQEVDARHLDAAERECL